MQAMPKYMGLRLKRYIPEETMFTVRSGANGFTVVRARLNDSTPTAPARNTNRQIPLRPTSFVYTRQEPLGAVAGIGAWD